jgi:SAM-dependent methyltransferase
LKSYSSQSRGPVALIREARSLIKAHSDIRREIAGVVDHVEAMERLVQERFDLRLSGLRMLDVGAGQRLLELKYFSVRNAVVGIDRDVIVEGFNPTGYARMLLSNGVRRTLKTIGRKLLGIDRGQTKELMRVVGGEISSEFNVLQMDAADMSFEDDSFDFVYSFAVFQHLENPARVVDEMRRVLAPGGVVYLDFILYTSRTGAHDLRQLGGGTADIPPWAHLRQGQAGLVQPSAFLNGLRLPEWRSLFNERFPGSETILVKSEQQEFEAEARRLQETGELRDYEIDELLTTKVAILWRKPLPVERDPVRPHETRAGR